ncbi:putative bifunctional diguanylate cyclase/phosphodiesterase [Segnochrobactraceae bacterium EtOH-i3]
MLDRDQDEGVYRVHEGDHFAWHHVSARLILDPVTGERTVIVNERDVSALKRIEQDLRDREAQLRESQNIARLGDWRYDVATRAFHTSPILRDVLGLDAPSIPATNFIARMHPDDVDGVWQHFLHSIEKKEESEAFFRFRNARDEMLQCWARWSPVFDPAGQPVSVHGVTRDVTQEYVARQRIHFLALHDAVTGLANRVHFTERLIGAVEGAAAVPAGGLIVLDIVHFKDINDSFGHGTGDQVLRELARRLHVWAGSTTLVARVGGDEFSVLLPGIGTADTLMERARDLVARLQEPMEIEGRRIRLAVRAGLSIWPDAGTTADTLQRNADLALYSTKSTGNASIALFTPALRTEADATRALLADLREALAGRALRPHFQPIVHLESGLVAGFEVLARWTHPVRGPVSPGQFIPVAESGGLIWELGDQMLTSAIAQMSSWLASGLEPGRIAVNMGSGQVNGPEIVAHVARRLSEAGLPAERLELEVTETVTLGHHAEAVMAALQDLSAQGIYIVLDDFGTGHASLTHLHGLPVDRIKIDRSFVMGIGRAQSSEVIIRAVIGLAHSLSLEVVAEGVETPEQASFLAACGCDCVQGYLYGYPMPADEATEWLARRQPPADAPPAPDA